MSFTYGRIAERVFDTPLMYEERKAEAFLRGLGGRISGGDIIIANGSGAIDHAAFSSGRPSAGRLDNRLGRLYDQANATPYPVIDGVAVIGIEGTLVHKGGWIGTASGETSYQGLQTQIIHAHRNKLVRGVVFETDSFGGEVNGAFETASMMQALSKDKPTISILTDYAYSAGYLLASQSRQIIMPEFGGAGSIGVIMMHADYSGAFEKQGIKVNIIRAGKRKAEGNPFETLPADLAARWQVQVEAMREKFAEVVSKGRSRRISKAKALSTEADAFDAKESLSLGLVDAIADPSAAFDAFIRAVNQR